MVEANKRNAEQAILNFLNSCPHGSLDFDTFVFLFTGKSDDEWQAIINEIPPPSDQTLEHMWQNIQSQLPSPDLSQNISEQKSRTSQ